MCRPNVECMFSLTDFYVQNLSTVNRAMETAVLASTCIAQYFYFVSHDKKKCSAAIRKNKYSNICLVSTLYPLHDKHNQMKK